MSDSEDKTKKVRLMIRADTPATEIFIINGQFERVGKGLGYLDIELQPGLYKVKYKAGSVIKQVAIALERGAKDLRLEGPEMDFDSPIPLSETRTTHEYHRETAIYESHQVRQRIGHGSNIFILTRDLEPSTNRNTLQGLTLHDLSGKLLLDFADGWLPPKEVEIYFNGLPAAGCAVNVDPGIYRLKVRVAEMDSLEQIVVASEDWQTQIFLTLSDYVPGAPGRYPDLTDMSVFMVRPGEGYNPNSADIRLTELARQGLENNRNVIPEHYLNEMFWGKYSNPMLGIYGAHLSLLSPDPELDYLEEVIRNLHRLVGAHPDVIALDIYLWEKQGKTNLFGFYPVPPMLRSSWDIVVNATSLKADLIPPNSLAYQISTRIWGYTPWLVWLSPPEEEEVKKAVSIPQKIDLKSMSSLASQIKKIVTSPAKLEKTAEKADLTPVEQNLLDYMYGTIRQEAFLKKITKVAGGTAKKKLPRAKYAGMDTKQMIQSLGMPAAVTSEALKGLVSKLGLPPKA